MEKMKANVLGTEYDIEIISERDATMVALDAEGYTDYSIKMIRVRDVTQNKGPEQQQNRDAYLDLIIRHELIHDFLYESGIDFGMQFHNEELVDWLAMQFPKMTEVFDEMEI